MNSLHPLEFGAQRIVVWGVIELSAVFDLGGIRFRTILIDRKPVKVGYRAQRRGVLSWIEAHISGIAVHVDGIAVDQCTDRRCIGH